MKGMFINLFIFMCFDGWVLLVVLWWLEYNGEFDGVVIVSVMLDDLCEVYDVLCLGEYSVLFLIFDDGCVVVWYLVYEVVWLDMMFF